MKQITTRLPVFFLALAIGGCSAFKSTVGEKEVAYKSARAVNSLEVPPDLTSVDSAQSLTVPGEGASFSAYQSGRPGGAPVSVVLPEQTNVHMERSGSQRWLVVMGEPAAVWPKVRDFWLQTGFVLVQENAQAGVMETDWAERRPDVQSDWLQKLLSSTVGTVFATATRDKFRTRLERGKQPGTTEIYISHRGLVEKVSELLGNEPVTTMWEPRDSDPELEAEFLRRLLVQLGVHEDRARQIVASAPATPASNRARLQQTGSDVILALADDFDSGWRRVGLSLDRIGFTVENRDRATGTYYVRYRDPDLVPKKKGFFGRIFSRSNKPSAAGYDYQIRISAAEQGSTVRVLGPEGADKGADVSRRILTLLHEQLR
ncbi:MAG: outer membrane protein assembly factor BamC [Gammaproteobacteria bacterium]|nr:outer membrane protein assembly factor BamC [Gammaproteobacteria bacterium]